MFQKVTYESSGGVHPGREVAGRPGQAVGLAHGAEAQPRATGKVQGALLYPDPEALRSSTRCVEGCSLTRQQRDQVYRQIAGTLPRRL